MNAREPQTLTEAGAMLLASLRLEKDVRLLDRLSKSPFERKRAARKYRPRVSPSEAYRINEERGLA